MTNEQRQLEDRTGRLESLVEQRDGHQHAAHIGGNVRTLAESAALREFDQRRIVERLVRNEADIDALRTELAQARAQIALLLQNGLRPILTQNALPAPGGDNGTSTQFARFDHGHP